MNTIRHHLATLLFASVVGSSIAETPPAYDPLEIRDAEFDAVATKPGGEASWIYEGSSLPQAVLVTPETPSEWWDGTVIRLLPGDSVMQGVSGDFTAGVGLFMGINARQEGSDSTEGALGVAVLDRDGRRSQEQRLAIESEWKREFATFISKSALSAPCFLRFSNHGSAPILLDKASLAKVVEDHAGFQPLFNGTDLQGWTGNTNGYGVEDGSIRTYPDRAGGNLYTEGQYGDFVFRFAFKVPPGANNGIAVRAPLGGDAAYQGMEFQVLENSHPKYAGLKDWQFHGSIYGLAPALRGYQAPPGEWNHEEICLVGRKARVILNGKVIMEVDLDEIQKDGTLSGRDHPGAARTEGHLGFCGHGDVVHFKDLRVRPVSGTKMPTGR